MTERRYTPGQIEFLKFWYLFMNIRQLTQAFNNEYGMDKTPTQIKALISRKGIVSGRDGKFKKGNSPWNADTKGQGLTGPNKGSFKKGNIPANCRPVGSERVDSKDGYILVKVAEQNPYTGAKTRFKHKHVHIYEQHNGPVPAGMVVIFKDGDRRNFDPGNLEAVTRSELARLNQAGYSRMPVELKPAVLAMTKLKVKVFERVKER
ncbi:HNH endonuclease signature motif containing protein [Desulfobacter vibrioformis]|uniref:HNH endonuclease signature motif containing protein n=1 Tax=Desulfobacter vibrioformis TaxID=34031 RepID=UPI00054D823A|nr:HNH endonuclease signature motif containing protein [Desulfobacter vibrioformis]